jgi:hypothetical protein
MMSLLPKIERTHEQRLRAAKSGKRLPHSLSILFLICALSSLTTLAKIVTYTPIPVPSAIQYQSRGGRRVIPQQRQQIERKIIVVQSSFRSDAPRSVTQFAISEAPETNPSAKSFAAALPLRSPPVL